MSEIKYTKEWFRKEIVERKKSIPEIAAEQNLPSEKIWAMICEVYVYSAWSKKLIKQAAENEAEKRKLVNAPTKKKKFKKTVKKDGAKPEMKLPYEIRLARKLALNHGAAIVDSNFVMNYYECCKEVENLMIPAFCIGELKSMAQFAENEKKRTEIERKIRYLEKNAQIIRADVLPEITISESNNREFKRRNINFARYVKYMWQLYGFRIPYLTCAYEANVLIKEYIKSDNIQA